MKKTVLFIATAAVMAFTSCSKDDATGGTITLPEPSLGSATIKGLVKANTDATNTTDELATGVKVIVTIDTKDWYPSNPPASAPEKRYEATTNADGIFEVNVEVGNAKKLGIVSVKVVDYLKNKVESATSTKQYKWSASAESANNLSVGEVRIVNQITMNGTPFN
jgi:hypothetical protein